MCSICQAFPAHTRKDLQVKITVCGVQAIAGNNLRCFKMLRVRYGFQIQTRRDKRCVSCFKSCLCSVTLRGCGAADYSWWGVNHYLGPRMEGAKDLAELSAILLVYF